MAIEVDAGASLSKNETSLFNNLLAHLVKCYKIKKKLDMPENKSSNFWNEGAKLTMVLFQRATSLTGITSQCLLYSGSMWANFCKRPENLSKVYT